MNELDQAWTELLASKIEQARVSGRHDIADYLALKQSNDAIRQAGVTWLLDSLIEFAMEANRRLPAVTVEREEPHEFKYRGGTMAGSLVRVRFGVRSMTVEAGWTRQPSHGFMRGGALAAARVSHFGMPKAGTELEFVRDGEVTVWRSGTGDVFQFEDIVKHLQLLVCG
jgi:hypothetical protein